MFVFLYTTIIYVIDCIIKVIFPACFAFITRTVVMVMKDIDTVVLPIYDSCCSCSLERLGT